MIGERGGQRGTEGDRGREREGGEERRGEGIQSSLAYYPWLAWHIEAVDGTACAASAWSPLITLDLHCKVNICFIFVFRFFSCCIVEDIVCNTV